MRGVIHLAAKKQVGESVEKPYYYYRENVDGLLTLLEVMRETGVDLLVFSSSAAVYGMPDVEFVTESTTTAPLSPYGETKLIGEWLTQAAATAHGLRFALLRYFNVAGAGRPELADTGVTNLIPMVFERLEAGAPPLLFGDDYPTPDGSCVRDFIHVADLARAHVAALDHLAAGGENLLLNIGRGEGASVREVLALVAEVTGLPTDPEVLPRRAGDPRAGGGLRRPHPRTPRLDGPARRAADGDQRLGGLADRSARARRKRRLAPDGGVDVAGRARQDRPRLRPGRRAGCGDLVQRDPAGQLGEPVLEFPEPDVGRRHVPQQHQDRAVEQQVGTAPDAHRLGHGVPDLGEHDRGHGECAEEDQGEPADRLVSRPRRGAAAARRRARSRPAG